MEVILNVTVKRKRTSRQAVGAVIREVRKDKINIEVCYLNKAYG
jgi:hypothetical protein